MCCVATAKHLQVHFKLEAFVFYLVSVLQRETMLGGSEEWKQGVRWIRQVAQGQSAEFIEPHDCVQKYTQVEYDSQDPCTILHSDNKPIMGRSGSLCWFSKVFVSILMLRLPIGFRQKLNKNNYTVNCTFLSSPND